ncbi:hypothetical protein IVG45_04770 [Methylomonas sp. LL1]|uniref:hypothetical protein n=1 Tax=Methylomonas sp. LL1 TaxID=2785785 RepID=UPI0018C42979|nr:hypothetical protein [Methylomonas sp. LL1]QPK64283.1 hypothetical protein IVG45_04770 [Methylomonas sp. LL1]
MGKSQNPYKYIIFGLVSLIGLFSFLPGEFVISTLLFAAVTYGGVLMIQSAIARDLKTKKTNKT